MRFMHYLVLSCLLLGLAVQATHFRYSNIQWRQLPGTRSIEFTITSAWRRDFPDFRVGSRAAGDFVVGETVTETATYFLPTTTSNSNGFLFTMLVNAVNYGSTSTTNVAQNWFIGVQTVTFTYGESLTAPIAYFQRCCRISTLVNNPDRWFRVETRLTVLNGKTRRGLEVSMLPIVTLFQNVARLFPIPVIALNATDVPTNGIRYRLATRDEAAGSGNSYTQAAGTNGAALSVDFVTGIVSWTPNNIGAYSTQIIVEGHTIPPTSTTDKSNMIVSHAIDFIVDVVAPSADNSPPTFTSFTSRTSLSSTVTTLTATTAGSYFTTVTLGATLTLVVTATDANSGDTVIVGNGAIPSGSNTTFTQNTNPGSLTFMWTPTATQLGSIVCFNAFDSRGLAAILNPCVTINVIAPDMSAEGTGLTYAVAGDQTTVFINNADSRQHSLTITGGPTSASAVIFNTGLQGRLSTQKRYNATYNHPWYPASAVTKSGFYALTIKDETPGQSGLLLYTLQVVPSVTSAPNCVPYDLGSSGLTGGTAQKKVFFFVQSRDRFDNDVTENRSPSGTNVETMEADIIFNSVTTLALGEYQSNGIWKITYNIPNFNEEANYTLSIYLKKVVGGTRSLVETLTPKIQPDEFSVTLKTFTPYVAGNPIYFEIEGTSTKHRWTASVAGVAIPTENITIPTGTPFKYTFTSAEPFYVARSYPNTNGIIATAPGLASGLVDSSFEVIPAEPYGPNSLMLSGVGDATAGETVEVSLQLFDVYGNMITSERADTFVSFSLSHPIEGSRSGNATWSQTTFTYSFTYKYDLIGTLDMEITVQSGSSAPQQVAQSPFSFDIEPADFSVSRSRTGYSGTFAAGDTSSMIILARDSFNNERTEGDDKIRASFQLAGQDANFSYTATPIPGTNRYSFSYTSTVAGTYEVTIEAYVPQEFDYVPFTTERVIVTPGAVVPSNTQMSGDGWTESSLPAGSSQQVLSQARDYYENVVTEEREVIFVAKVTPQGSTTSTYFSSSYVAPIGGGACFGSVSSDYVIQNLQTTTISAAEQLLAADGYHKLSYTVPDNGRYTVELSLCNSTKTVGLVNARDMLDTGCDSVGNQVLTSNARQTNFSFKDNYGAIAGTAIGGAIALGGLFYVGWRLHRYRPKYLAEKKRAEEAQAELEEIGKEVDIIPAHGENGDLEPSKDEDLPPPSKSGTLKGVPVPKQQVDEAPDVKMDISRPQIRKEFAPVRPAAKTDAALAAPDVDPIAGAKSL